MGVKSDQSANNFLDLDAFKGKLVHASDKEVVVSSVWDSQCVSIPCVGVGGRWNGLPRWADCRHHLCARPLCALCERPARHGRIRLWRWVKSVQGE